MSLHVGTRVSIQTLSGIEKKGVIIGIDENGFCLVQHDESQTQYHDGGDEGFYCVESKRRVQGKYGYCWFYKGKSLKPIAEKNEDALVMFINKHITEEEYQKLRRSWSN